MSAMAPPPANTRQGRLRARIARWRLARQAPSDTIALRQRDIYILPTRAGWMLGATLLVLLLASINYQLNLGYLLTFLLAGCAAASMHLGHATLRGLALNLIPPEPQYAGAAALLRVALHNRRRRARYAVGMAVRGSGQWAYGDVPAQGSTTIEVAFRPARRGLHPVPMLTAETRFPIGTFRVWTLWRPSARMLVYPAPEAHPPPLPPGEPVAGGGTHAGRQRATGEFEGLRAYRSGDPMRLIAWKQTARAQATAAASLVSRDSGQPQRQQLWLDAQHTGLAEPEARLARLCAWVAMADRLGIDYGLAVAGRRIEPGQGEAHRRRCLEALATC